MELDDINYRSLRRIQQLEKTQPLLTKIDQHFYQHLNNYLKNLESAGLINQDRIIGVPSSISLVGVTSQEQRVDFLKKIQVEESHNK